MFPCSKRLIHEAIDTVAFNVRLPRGFHGRYYESGRTESLVRLRGPIPVLLSWFALLGVQYGVVLVFPLHWPSYHLAPP